MKLFRTLRVGGGEQKLILQTIAEILLYVSETGKFKATVSTEVFILT